MGGQDLCHSISGSGDLLGPGFGEELLGQVTALTVDCGHSVFKEP